MPDEATTDELTACVLHTGCLDRDGYGRVSRGYAHRAAWEAAHGPVPPRLDLHHVCENPACVNATHLEPVTRKQHMALHAPTRALHAPTHCVNGHPFDAANTYARPDRGRRCRACKRAQDARYRERVAS
jgi:hypothetical protein